MLPKYYIDLNLNISNMQQLLDYGSNKAYELGFITDKDLFSRELIKREQEITTAIGKGVAFPHGRSKTVLENFVIIIRLNKGIDFNALDGQNVCLFFLIGTKEDDYKYHLTILQRIAKGLLQPQLKDIFLLGDTAKIKVLFNQLFQLNIGIETTDVSKIKILQTQFPNFNFYQVNYELVENLNITDRCYKLDSDSSFNNVINELERLSKR